MRGRVEEGRRIGDTLVEEGRAVRIRRGGKTPWKRLSFPKGRARTSVSEGSGQERVRGRERGSSARQDGWRSQDLPRWMEETKGEAGGERGGRGGGQERNKDGRSRSGVDPPTVPPRGNKRKKGRKLRSNAEGGRSACRGATNEATNGMTRGTGRVGWPGDGYPRGKQFLLIQRSHPHGGASLVDPLLDLSSPRSILFYPFSPGLAVSLSFSLFSFSSRERTWLLRTSASPLATLDSYPSYPSFPFFPLLSEDDFTMRRSIRFSAYDRSRSIIS